MRPSLSSSSEKPSPRTPDLDHETCTDPSTHLFAGEGANHAIVDVAKLLDQLQPLLRKEEKLEDANVLEAVERYESEMIGRTELAVLASRQACLDAHNWSRLNDRSPLVRRRLMKADLEVMGSERK